MICKSNRVDDHMNKFFKAAAIAMPLVGSPVMAAETGPQISQSSQNPIDMKYKFDGTSFSGKYTYAEFTVDTGRKLVSTFRPCYSIERDVEEMRNYPASPQTKIENNKQFERAIKACQPLIY